MSATSSIISNFDNLVIDADAINSYNFSSKNILLTPHLGELKRLGSNSSEEELIFTQKHMALQFFLRAK